jgi:hypothetical protein
VDHPAIDFTVTTNKESIDEVEALAVDTFQTTAAINHQ